MKFVLALQRHFFKERLFLENIWNHQYASHIIKNKNKNKNCFTDGFVENFQVFQNFLIL